jgi:hypothetical protein
VPALSVELEALAIDLKLLVDDVRKERRIDPTLRPGLSL